MSNSADFSTLPLHADLLKNLSSLGYASMTAIQQQSLPKILDGKDVIAQAKTGSGKTAAFGLGLLNKLEVKTFQPQSLVLCPTRELADQVAGELRKLGRSIANIKILTLCGGTPFAPQADSLSHGVHIIVGTPGRILDHLQRQSMKLNQLNCLVLDEADRMLEMGFQDSVEEIIDHLSDNRQTLLFSATFPEQIEAMAKRIMQSPIRVKAEEELETSTIEQHFYALDTDEQRLQACRLLLLKYAPESAVIFCNTKKECQNVANTLNKLGFTAQALHGDLEQRDRDQTLVRFANKSISVLVATDVAARGLDIENLDLVINYHLAHDPEVHVHRIGRTGRAGQQGRACSFFDEADGYRMVLLSEIMGQEIKAEPLPPQSLLDQTPQPAAMVTLRINAGKKQKIRPGDILGALTGKGGIEGKQVGKIKMAAQWAYVAVQRDVAKRAINILQQNKLKGKSCRAQIV